MTSVHRVRFTVELAYSQLYEFFRLLESWGGGGRPCRVRFGQFYGSFGTMRGSNQWRATVN